MKAFTGPFMFVFLSVVVAQRPQTLQVKPPGITAVTISVSETLRANTGNHKQIVLFAVYHLIHYFRLP